MRTGYVCDDDSDGYQSTKDRENKSKKPRTISPVCREKVVFIFIYFRSYVCLPNFNGIFAIARDDDANFVDYQMTNLLFYLEKKNVFFPFRTVSISFFVLPLGNQNLKLKPSCRFPAKQHVKCKLEHCEHSVDSRVNSWMIWKSRARKSPKKNIQHATNKSCSMFFFAIWFLMNFMSCFSADRDEIWISFFVVFLFR